MWIVKPLHASGFLKYNDIMHVLTSFTTSFAAARTAPLLRPPSFGIGPVRRFWLRINWSKRSKRAKSGGISPSSPHCQQSKL